MSGRFPYKKYGLMTLYLPHLHLDSRVDLEPEGEGVYLLKSVNTHKKERERQKKRKTPLSKARCKTLISVSLEPLVLKLLLL